MPFATEPAVVVPAAYRATTWSSVATIAGWIVLLALPSLLAIPLWPWAQTRQIATRDSLVSLLLLDGSLQAALASILISLVVLAVVRRYWIFAALTWPFMVLMPVEAWYVLTYGQPTAAHVFGVIAESSFGEASEFVGTRALFVALVLASWAAASAWLTVRFRSSGAAWAHRSRNGFLAVVLGTGVAGTFVLWETAPAASPTKTQAMADLAPDAQDESDKVTAIYPWGVPMRLAEFEAQRRLIVEYASRTERVPLGARLERSRAPRNVVLVVGESLRADRFGLNGYERDTTPLLRGVPNLFNFPDAVVATATTRTSVPHMITRLRPGIDPIEAYLNERSLLSAFSEAGYRVWWISNHLTVGRHDNTIAILAAEADVRRFVNFSNHGTRSRHDEVLVNELRQALLRPGDRRLIVIHMLGSHFNYRNRYPDRFDIFQPSLSDEESVNPYDAAKKQQIRNAYDNSILYTDHVLASIIRELEATGDESTLLFMADHGQALFDGFCATATHGLLSSTVLHVPLFVWASENFLARREETRGALSANRSQPITVESVYPTLLDLGGVSLLNDKHELSLANPQYRGRARAVSLDTRRWLDYDRDLPGRDCASPQQVKTGRAR